MSVCVFSIEIQTAGRIGTKFGTEGKVLGGVSTRYPHPPGMGCVKGVRGASGASTVHFGKNFIKQKLQVAPDLVGWVTFLGPKSGSGRTWAPCPSGDMVTHYEGYLIKPML